MNRDKAIAKVNELAQAGNVDDAAVLATAFNISDTELNTDFRLARFQELLAEMLSCLEAVTGEQEEL